MYVFVHIQTLGLSVVEPWVGRNLAPLSLYVCPLLCMLALQPSHLVWVYDPTLGRLSAAQMIGAGFKIITDL